MGTYIIRRLLIAIPIFFGITILVFMLLALAPGDPVSAFIRPELAGNEEMRRIITLRYGLDQPLPIRYIHWLAEALQGNLGYKLQGAGLPVLDTVARGLVASLILMGTALLIGIFVGIPLGILSALRQYSKTDYALTGVAFLGISIPSFMLGLGGLYLFGLTFRIFPIGGMVTAGAPFSVPDLLSTPRPAGAHPGRRLRRDPDALHPLVDARGARLPVCHDRGRQGSPATGRRHPPRVPQRPHPDHHDHRPVAAGAGRRRGHHRDGLQLARAWAT